MSYSLYRLYIITNKVVANIVAQLSFFRTHSGGENSVKLPNRSAESADGGSRAARPALPLQAPSTSYSGFPIWSWSIPWIARFLYISRIGCFGICIIGLDLFSFSISEFHATGFEALATFDWFNIKSLNIHAGQSLSNNIIRDCPSEDGFEF